MNRFILIIVLLIFLTAAIQAGSISGYVCDARGNPLVGATVMVVGTSHGAMTDAYGEYFIEDLEPGEYSLQASMVGMSSRTIEGIRVTENQITTYNFGEPGFGSGSQNSINGAQSGRILVSREDLTVTDLPLEHTSASIVISGNVQNAVVQQVYSNPFEEPIEAVYVFPLPNNGAVNEMMIYIGDKMIKGHVYESETASELYDEAIEEGRTAGLLVQERPNVFTQSIGNILPGDSITVEIHYLAPVDEYEDEFEIVFPTVVGPKYIPGCPTGEGERGWSDPTDQVPDADRINPSVYPEGTRSGYDIEIDVSINAGIPIEEIYSVNHEIETIENGNTVQILLAEEEAIPNRDFVLRYSLSTHDRESGLLSTNGDTGGHLMLVIKPEADLSNDSTTPKEYVFVVDCSGSMSGQPIAVAKETMRNFIRDMNTDDTFQIIKFSNQASSFSEAPIEASRRNVNLGLAYVELMRGSGGTEMLNGVRAALGYPEDPDRDRFVIFLTDGEIGNEAAVLEEVRSMRGERTLLWSVGIGSSPNRYLLDGLAEEGHGESFFVGLQEDPSTVATRIHGQITGEYINNVSIDWDDLPVTDVFPEELPLLFPGEPLFIVGKYTGGGSGTITVSGNVGEDNWTESLSVHLPYHEDKNEAIATIWARERIHQLERYLLDAQDSESEQTLIEQITETALEYQILCDYTSFVAISEEIRTDSQGNSISVEIPVNMPEGMSYAGVFGSGTGGLAPVAVGSTTITTTDSRGILYTGTSGPSDTFVSSGRDLSIALESGASVSILSIVSSSSVLDEDDIADFASRVMNLAAEIYSNQSKVSDGLLILRISIPASGGIPEVTVLQNFTESSEFAMDVSEAIVMLPLDIIPDRSVDLEVSIEFASSD